MVCLYVLDFKRLIRDIGEYGIPRKVIPTITALLPERTAPPHLFGTTKKIADTTKYTAMNKPPGKKSKDWDVEINVKIQANSD